MGKIRRWRFEMARLAHKATDDLPAEAWRLMHAGFRMKKTYRAIAADLEEIGCEVAERTIARRAVEWRHEQSRKEAVREQVKALVEAMQEGKWESAEMIRALATEALMQNPDAFANSDPLAVQRQNLQAEELRIKRETLELRRQQHELDAAKFEAMQRREEEAKQAADELAEKAGRGEKLTADDIERIRGIYGLN